MKQVGVLVRHALSHLTADGWDRTGEISDFGPSLTVQDQAADADINEIMRRFGVTGMAPISGHVLTFGDFSGVFDFQTAMNAVNAAQRHFMALPAELRSRFGNDPQEYVAFCSDASNLDEMEKLGLLDEKVVASRQKARQDAEDARTKLAVDKALADAKVDAGK